MACWRERKTRGLIKMREKENESTHLLYGQPEEFHLKPFSEVDSSVGFVLDLAMKILQHVLHQRVSVIAVPLLFS